MKLRKCQLAMVLVGLGMAWMTVGCRQTMAAKPEIGLSTVAMQEKGMAETADPVIAKLVTMMSEEALLATVRDLEAFKSRTVGQPGNAKAADYLHARLSKLPGLQVVYQDAKWRNVVATLPGSDPASKELYVVGAHYDCESTKPDDSPGAMDDATGVAIVLEMARILSSQRFRQTMVFACWNAEECGLHGAKSFVKQLQTENRRVSLYLNYDSTGYDPQGRLVLDLIANPPATSAKDLLKTNNQRYGINFTLEENRHNCGGDFVPFWQAGFPTINSHQEVHGAHYHTSNDKSDLVSTRYAAKNGQLGISVIAILAERQPAK
jgi:hypothetical protein